MKNKLLLFTAFLLLFCLYNVFAGGSDPKAKPARVWTGIVSSNWFEMGNWAPYGTPNAGDSVIIPGNTPNDPMVEAIAGTPTAICKGLNVESDGKSTLGGMVISGGEIIIDGSMTIKSGATVTLASDGALTVNGDIKIMSAGGLIIESGGSLITNGTITGSAFVKRTIPADLSWHFLSCPVTSHSILNGVFAPTAANFASTPSATFDFYKFNEQCSPLWWINLRSSDGTVNTSDFGNPPVFEVKTGYLVAYGSGFPSTKVYTGTPNTGDMTFTLVANDLCAWNLLGNPYPSALAWDNVTGKSNLSSGYYYVWNENKAGGPGYEAYLDNTFKTPGTDGNIPSMQGFFVLATPTGGKAIDVPNTARIHDGDLWLKKTEESMPNKLTLTFGNQSNFDQAYVYFCENGTTGIDWFDAAKIMSLNENIPQVYTFSDNSLKTLFNSLPYTTDQVAVPVGIVAPVDGDYSLKAEGLENFCAPALTLEDREMNVTQDLVQNPVYNFHATGKEDAGRFVLHFSSPIGINDQNENSPVRIFSSHRTVVISGKADLQNGLVSVFNLLGQEVLSQMLPDASMNRIQVNSTPGYYIVKVKTEGTVTTTKVHIAD
jgi:hypothetical protein